jgi:hypothetical protein
MDTPYSYSKRGGARVGAICGTWPMGRIAISMGIVTVKVIGRSRTLSVADVLRVEPLRFISGYEGGPGVRLFFRGQLGEESVDFYSLSARSEVLAELKQAGFNVVEMPRS